MMSSSLTIPEDADWKNVLRDIERVVCEWMSFVCGTVPIAAQDCWMKRWFKNAKPIGSHAGELLIW